MAAHILRRLKKRAGAVHRRFAISPLVGDFNGDHLPDLIWTTLKGPAQAFINATPDRNWIELRVDDTAEYLNAQVEVQIGERTLHRQLIASQGLASDQTHKLMIGLGDASEASVILTSVGSVRTQNNVQAGTVLDWTTGAQ